jgi:VanZ family protein
VIALVHPATVVGPTVLLSVVLLPLTWAVARAVRGRPVAALLASGSLVAVIDATVMRPGLLHRYANWSGVAAACQLTDPSVMSRDAVLNVALLLPFGFFAVLALRGTMPTLVAVPIVVLSATTISVVVEATQAAYRVGACDSSDVVHNTVGAVLGALLGALASGSTRQPPVTPAAGRARGPAARRSSPR